MDESTFQSGKARATRAVPEDDERDNGILCEKGEFEPTMEANEEQYQHQAVRAEKIVGEVIEMSTRSVASREVLATIVALGRRLEHLRSEELERFRSKLATLEPGQRGIIEALTQGIVSRILYGPVCELNAHAGAPEQHVLTQLVRRIFRVA